MSTTTIADKTIDPLRTLIEHQTFLNHRAGRDPSKSRTIALAKRGLAEFEAKVEALAAERDALRKAAARLAGQASPRLDGMGNTVWAVLDEDLKSLEALLARTPETAPKKPLSGEELCGMIDVDGSLLVTQDEATMSGAVFDEILKLLATHVAETGGDDGED